MTPAATRRLESFFAAAARAAAAELRGLAGASADAGEVAERALHAADAQHHLGKDERTRAWSALARWASADVPASELATIFRTTAATFGESLAARRMAELEASSAEHRNTTRAGRISASRRVAPAPTVH